MSTVSVEHLLVLLRQEEDELNAIPEVRLIAEAVAALDEQLKLTRDSLDSLEPERRARIADLRERIISSTRSLGHGAKGSGYEVAYRRGYTRGSWDSKGLQGYAVHDPKILAFYSESEVAPSISIKDLT